MRAASRHIFFLRSVKRYALRPPFPRHLCLRNYACMLSCVASKSKIRTRLRVRKSNSISLLEGRAATNTLSRKGRQISWLAVQGRFLLIWQYPWHLTDPAHLPSAILRRSGLSARDPEK